MINSPCPLYAVSQRGTRPASRTAKDAIYEVNQAELVPYIQYLGSTQTVYNTKGTRAHTHGELI